MNQIDDENKKRNVSLGFENLFERFIHFHPGITHGCGVPKGGTFIMVYDKRNEVTADFYLPYIISSTLRPIQYTLLEAQTITLSGLITNANKNPIEGAKVTIQGNIVLSNNDGGYSSIVAANATIQVTVSAEGYAEEKEDISIEGVSKEYDFVLKEIEINHTTTVQFLDENKKQIRTDIPLTSDVEKSLIAEKGVLKVLGTQNQEFKYTVIKGVFNKKSFTVKIKDKDTTQDVNLTATKKGITKDTWVFSDFDEKILKGGLSVSLNGTKIKVGDKAHTQNHKVSYNEETLTIEVNGANPIEYTTERIPLSKINAVIVFLTDDNTPLNGGEIPTKKSKTGDTPDKKVPIKELEKREFFTFTKEFRTSEVASLVDFHPGFKKIPVDSVLVKNNFYCLFLTPDEVSVLKKLLLPH